MNIDEELKEMREAINIESHIALQLNTLLCKCNVCNAIGNLYIFLTIFKPSNIVLCSNKSGRGDVTRSKVTSTN